MAVVSQKSEAGLTWVSAGNFLSQKLITGNIILGTPCRCHGDLGHPVDDIVGHPVDDIRTAEMSKHWQCQDNRLWHLYNGHMIYRCHPFYNMGEMGKLKNIACVRVVRTAAGAELV